MAGLKMWVQLSRTTWLCGALAVLSGQLIVDLEREHAVGVAVRRGHQQVLRKSVRAAEVLRRPESDRRRRGLAEQVLGNAIAGERRAAARILKGKACDAGKIAVAPRLHRNRAERFDAASLGVLFVVGEEEGMVAPHGSADGAAELIAIQPARLRQKCIARVKHIVAPELEQRTVRSEEQKSEL